MRADSDTRLRALIRNAADSQWSLDEKIDWERRVVRPWWLPTRTYVAIVSQLFYAERATLQVCERLVGELPEADARDFLRLQIQDERRHIAAYRRYLECLGDIAPINEAVATALEGALAYRGSYLGAIVAFHVVLEGEAVQLQHDLSEMFPCPLLHTINDHVSRDEARHVAFGRIYLRDRLRALPSDERLSIYSTVKDLWHTCSHANKGARRSSAIIRLGRKRLAERWSRQARTLIGIGLVSDEEARRA